MREELYAQCFDELIRQVTINCAERGLLLLRVRDEARMSIAAYQTLYESSVAFCMRKALGGEQGKSDAEARIEHLEGRETDLERQVAELKARCDSIERGRRSDGRRRRRGTRRRLGSCRRATSSSNSSWRSSSAPRRTPSEERASQS